MTHTPIYEEVRRTLGRADRAGDRQAFRDHAEHDAERIAPAVTLRAGGGRHRRPGD